VPRPEGSYLNGGAAYYRIYRTADGRHAVLGAVEAKFWRNFCMAADRPDWIDRQNEPIPQHALIGDFAVLLGTRTLAENLAIFGAVDCCFSPVLDLAEAVASPHHAARGVVRRDEDESLQALFPAFIDGEPPGPRPPLRQVDLDTLLGGGSPSRRARAGGPA
jgi:crotonobetainyl-CoA:carnitine CoA-transferase CaiB-like acyl-CoA transferase